MTVGVYGGSCVSREVEGQKNQSGLAKATIVPWDVAYADVRGRLVPKGPLIGLLGW